jgi:hypothetical protein
MPKTPMDYSNTVIYKLVSYDLNITDCYVGHTTNFKQRKNDHKRTCNNENGKSYNFHVYSFIRENGGWKNWDMIEIEKYPCNDIYEALKRERFWYEELKATLNADVPSRTNKEYYEAKKGLILENAKIYRDTNKDLLKEKRILYIEENKDEIKAKRKIYREAKKEKINAKKREQYEANKDEISKKAKIYRDANKDLLKEKRILYVEANKEIIREKKAQIYQANKDEINAKRRENREANKDEINAKRREKARLIREAKKVEKDT